MNKTVIIELKNDWIIQEIVTNVIPAPAITYFAMMCFPFVKSNMIQFLSLVIVAVAVCFFYGVFIRKRSSRFMVQAVTVETKDTNILKNAKVEAMAFPFKVTFALIVRWSLLGNAIIFFPFLIMGDIPFSDYIILSFFLLFAATSSVPFSFLLSEHATSSFLADPAINRLDIADRKKWQVLLTYKVFFLTVLCLVSVIGNYSLAIISAAKYDISIGSIKLGFGFLIVQSFLLSLWSLYLLARNIRQVLGQMLTFFEDMAKNEGDLNRDITIGSNDELGDLAGFFNMFLGNLRTLITQIKDNAITLKGTAGHLSDIAHSMKQNAEKSSDTTHTVAAASEEMDTNLTVISKTLEDSFENTQTISKATQEMALTAKAIAKSTRKTQSITENAVSFVQDAKSQVDELGGHAEEIGKMTEEIAAISGQTNLLALNATIEAARAGDAGRGFTIVANEIKELSNKTAEVTRRITAMVESIQSSSKITVEKINEIASVMEKVNKFVTGITHDVSEQQKTTVDINAMINDSSEKNSSIHQSTSEIAQVVHDIATHIQQVNLDVGDFATKSKTLSQYGNDMSDLSARLTSLISQFQV